MLNRSWCVVAVRKKSDVGHAFCNGRELAYVRIYSKRILTTIDSWTESSISEGEGRMLLMRSSFDEERCCEIFR